MLVLTVPKEASNQSLIKFLNKTLKNISPALLHKLFRKKEIKVNGHWQKSDYIVQVDDVIKIFAKNIEIKDIKTDIEHEYNLDIIFENDDIMIINKPVGILSQKDDSGDIDINSIIQSKIQSAHGFTPSITNRLDRNTSGLLTIGKSYLGLKTLSETFRQKKVRKTYITVVEGILLKKIHQKARLKREKLTSKISSSGQEIETIVRPVRSIGKFTICEVEILTGRTHQIRAHLSYLGFPIVGDTKYGANNTYNGFRLKYHLLHCEKIKFDNDIECGLSNMLFSAPLPHKFDSFIKFIERIT